jgi:transcriptional regulator with XRE-family HTH domain
MDDATYRTRLGERIREVRKQRGYPIAKDFAAALGIGAPQLSRIEGGTRSIDSMLLRRIAELLKVSIDDLFPRERAVTTLARGGRDDAEHMKDMVEWARRLREDIDVVARYAGRPT